MQSTGTNEKWALKIAKKKDLTLLTTLAEKKTVALICTLVARLTEVEVKTIGHTVTYIEMKEFVAFLSDPRITMKSRRPSTQGIKG